MKSLGASQRFVITASSYQLLALGMVGIIVGCLVGFAAERVLTAMLADLIANDLPPPGFGPVRLAAGSALVLLAGFAMPSLLQLRNTPPLRVLRHDEMPPPPSRLLIAGTSLMAVAALLYGAIGDARMLVIVLEACSQCLHCCTAPAGSWSRCLAGFVAALGLPGDMAWQIFRAVAATVRCKWSLSAWALPSCCC
jgi:predicted lysophospholipase L1 biosynthesis ABC-type transport system permease subunit